MLYTVTTLYKGALKLFCSFVGLACMLHTHTHACLHLYYDQHDKCHTSGLSDIYDIYQMSTSLWMSAVTQCLTVGRVPDKCFISCFSC